MSLPHQEVVLIISKAREQAKELPTQVERQGHPQSNEAGTVCLALVNL